MVVSRVRDTRLEMMEEGKKEASDALSLMPGPYTRLQGSDSYRV